MCTFKIQMLAQGLVNVVHVTGEEDVLLSVIWYMVYGILVWQHSKQQHKPALFRADISFSHRCCNGCKIDEKDKAITWVI